MERERRTAAAPRPGFARAYAAGFSAFTLIYAAVMLAAGATASQAVRFTVAAMLPNALSGIAGVSVARLSPLRRERAYASVAANAAWLFALTFLATGGWAALVALDSWAQGKGFGWRGERAIVVWQSLTNGLVQLAVIGIGHAWHAAERAARAADRAARAEALRSRAELQLLRSQLNPHFLLNTLHALLGLVRRDPAKAEAALERLGELLRYGLHVHHASVDRVPLRQEWAFVSSYLELEQLRLGDRLRLELSADDEAMDVTVPPFALQPLVENAVTHAIAPRRTGGRLGVRARRLDGRLRLEVEDDGPGSSEAAVLESPRLGLRLLRERLQALYAGEARLVFEPAAQGGLRVVLELPDNGPSEAA